MLEMPCLLSRSTKNRELVLLCRRDRKNVCRGHDCSRIVGSQRSFISQCTDFHFAKYRFSFRKVQIFISQSTDFHFAKYRFHFAKYRFSFRKVQISFRKVQIFISQSTDFISQSTDFHFAKYRFHFVSFRFVSQSTISQSTISPFLSDIGILAVTVNLKSTFKPFFT